MRSTGIAAAVSTGPLPSALTARTSKTYSKPLTRFPTVTPVALAPTFSQSLHFSPTAAYRYS